MVSFWWRNNTTDRKRARKTKNTDDGCATGGDATHPSWKIENNDVAIIITAGKVLILEEKFVPRGRRLRWVRSSKPDVKAGYRALGFISFEQWFLLLLHPRKKLQIAFRCNKSDHSFIRLTTRTRMLVTLANLLLILAAIWSMSLPDALRNSQSTSTTTWHKLCTNLSYLEVGLSCFFASIRFWHQLACRSTRMLEELYSWAALHLGTLFPTLVQGTLRPPAFPDLIIMLTMDGFTKTTIFVPLFTFASSHGASMTVILQGTFRDSTTTASGSVSPLGKRIIDSFFYFSRYIY